jgi:putative FmdB family regulatory protein
MPIYAYRCNACGHAQDVLQKMSDPLLTTCPSCGVQAYQKQVTAAGFQLKGSGWYATDFKAGAQTPAKPNAEAAPAKTDAPADKPASAGAATSAVADKPSKPATPSSTP